MNEKEKLFDLTKLFDSIDFGVELTGNWQEDEKRLYDKQVEDMAKEYLTLSSFKYKL